MRDAERLARTFIEHIEALRFPEAFSLLADDARYVLIGKTPISGEYNGMKDLEERLFPALGAFVVPPTLKFEDPVVDGDRVVMLASGTGQGPYGPYDQPHYAFVTRVRGDKFVEVIEFMDTEMVRGALYGEGPLAA